LFSIYLFIYLLHLEVHIYVHTDDPQAFMLNNNIE